MCMQPIFNKYAGFSYEILDKLEVGLVLTGSEVKSIRNGQISLKSAYVSITYNPRPELFLFKASISAYKKASSKLNYDPERPRKLLVNKSELKSLVGKLEQKGLTIIPLKVYTKRNLVKMEIALARGKKTYEKKEQIKTRDVEREIRRTLKREG